MGKEITTIDVGSPVYSLAYYNKSDKLLIGAEDLNVGFKEIFNDF